jgi:hypothetical protein
VETIQTGKGWALGEFTSEGELRVEIADLDLALGSVEAAPHVRVNRDDATELASALLAWVAGHGGEDASGVLFYGSERLNATEAGWIGVFAIACHSGVVAPQLANVPPRILGILTALGFTRDVRRELIPALLSRLDAFVVAQGRVADSLRPPPGDDWQGPSGGAEG